MEFETFRRLPESRFILFTVRTYQDPVRGVERAPVAAQALSGAVRRHEPAGISLCALPRDCTLVRVKSLFQHEKTMVAGR